MYYLTVSVGQHLQAQLSCVLFLGSQNPGVDWTVLSSGDWTGEGSASSSLRFLVELKVSLLRESLIGCNLIKRVAFYNLCHSLLVKSSLKMRGLHKDMQGGDNEDHLRLSTPRN